MSDLTPDRLRDLAMVVAPAVLTPEFDNLRRAARRRRARRNGLVTATAAVAVAGAAVAGSTSWEIPRGSAGRHPDHRPATVSAYRGSGDGMVFLTTSTGYRFSYLCSARPASCQLRLAATTDGGHTWQARPVPRPPTPAKDGATDLAIQVLGPRTLLLPTGDERGLLSTDGGFHWAAISRRVTAPVAAVRKSDVAFVSCAQTGCTHSRLVVADPATGAEAPLRNQPPLTVLYQNEVIGSDGSIWVSGKAADGRTAVASSHDGGRSWVTSALPGLGPANETTLNVVTWDGRRAYAVVIAAGTNSRDVPIARTDDSGRTWLPLPLARGALGPAAALSAAVLPDGRLAITQQDPRLGVVASSDGVTFERLGDAPAIQFFAPFPGGLLGQGDGPDGAPAIFLTTDGHTWRNLGPER
jgi:photosystem II stability/assembly factor-like uncharacterized protein